MLNYVLFDMNLFADGSDRDTEQKRVLWLLQALKNCNRLYLQQNPDTPLIYQSGIKYKLPEQFEKEQLPEVAEMRAYLEKKGAPKNILAAFKSLSDQVGSGEHFREIPTIIKNGGGDCDNVATWRAAELCELGIAAEPYIMWRKRPDGGTTYHVITRWPDGTSEDPSLLLGMGGEERAEDRKEEVRKLAERTEKFVKALAANPHILGADFMRRARSMKLAREAVLGRDNLRTRRLERADYFNGPDILGALAATPFSAQGTTPSDFGKGLQYTIPFQTDDAYEDWSPTRPPAFYADPRYPGGGVQGTPYFNTRIRDVDALMDDGEILGASAAELADWELQIRRMKADRTKASRK